MNRLNQWESLPFNYISRHWVEVNKDERGTYNINVKIKSRITMRAPSVCGPDNAYFTGSVTKMQEDQK